MNFKKRVNGSWVDTPNYIHNTFTDTITTLPADIYPTGTTATVGLKGNMEQSSTPTPTTPIQPQECGERTGNLFDENYPNIKVDTPTYRSIYVGDGTFTLSTTTAQLVRAANLFFLSGKVGSGVSTQNNGVWNGNPRTVAAVDGYITIAYRYYENDETSDPRSNDVMLNSGSTPLPYEPYGYKIPISSAGQTTTVYLGEVETTRKIKKLVLTGEENWQIWKGDYYSGVIDKKGAINTIVCSHFINSITGGISYGKSATAGLKIAAAAVPFITSVSELKTWLAAQYAAGTPVIIWYVLATPETGIVNEPLMKIGDYADEVSNVSIPVTTGGDTLSVGTTVQPSEVTVNYKGWHPMQSVHERSNGAWT